MMPATAGRPGAAVGSLPPDSGSQCSVTPKIVSAMSPIQKYGTLDRKVLTGTTASVRRDPRRQPTTIPARVPSRKLTTVAVPTSPIVHGRLWASTVPTEVGK
jgi:hypothetical protein